MTIIMLVCTIQQDNKTNSTTAVLDYVPVDYKDYCFLSKAKKCRKTNTETQSDGYPSDTFAVYVI